MSGKPEQFFFIGHVSNRVEYIYHGALRGGYGGPAKDGSEDAKVSGILRDGRKAKQSCITAPTRSLDEYTSDY